MVKQHNTDSQETTSITDSEEPTKQQQIQLLLASQSDRKGIKEILGNQYEAITDATVQHVDGYIIDSASFQRHKEAIRQRKLDQHPTFCPVLLVQARESGLLNEFADGAEKVPLVDDVMDAPIDPTLLHRRLPNLLSRRARSIELARENEELNARFKALFNSIPDPAFALDATGAVIEINDAFCATFETDKTSTLNKPLADVETIGTEIPETVTETESVDDSTQATSQKVKYTGSDGGTRHAVLSTQTVVVESNTYKVNILTDITEIRNKTLRLEQFAHVVAHDVRNPLQVAQARLEYISEAIGEHNQHAKVTRRSLERIEDLINKLLTIARTGSSNLTREEISTEHVAEQAWKTVSTAEATLVIDLPTVHSVYAEEGRLVQLFENLFRNAVEHAGDAVTVHVGNLESGFYVEDDGPGIPPGTRNSIFDMGHTTESQGTGLGLNIVAEVVEAHSWSIFVPEGCDSGARFEITDI